MAQLRHQGAGLQIVLSALAASEAHAAAQSAPLDRGESVGALVCHVLGRDSAVFGCGLVLCAFAPVCVPTATCMCLCAPEAAASAGICSVFGMVRAGARQGASETASCPAESSCRPS